MRAFVNECRTLADTETLSACSPSLFERLIELWNRFDKFWADAAETSAASNVRVNLRAIRLVLVYVQRAQHWLSVSTVEDEVVDRAATDLTRASLCFVQFRQQRRDISHHLRMPRSNQSRVKEDPNILVRLKVDQDKAVTMWHSLQKMVPWDQVWRLAPISVAEPNAMIEQCEVTTLQAKRNQTLEKKREGRKLREKKKQRSRSASRESRSSSRSVSPKRSSSAESE